MHSKTKKAFIIIFGTLFVDLLAFTLILPLLPKILDYYATNDKSGAYKFFNDNIKSIQTLLNIPETHNQVLLAGFLGSWFSLLQFISSPFFGALSDRFGRKPIILIAMFGSSLSYLMWFKSSSSFALFILSRTIGGLSKANVGLSLAIVSDVSDENSRAKGMAIVGSSFSLAFIFGPSLGAYLSTLANDNGLGDEFMQTQLITNPSMIAMLLSISNLILISTLLEETNSLDNGLDDQKLLVKSNNQSQSIKISNAFQYVNPKSLFGFTLIERKSKIQATVLSRIGFIYFYYLLLYSGLEFTLSFLTHIRFDFTSMDQGKLYLFSGSLMALIQGGYIRRIKGGKEATMAFIGLTTIVPSFIMMGLSSSVKQIYVSLALYSFSSAVVVPCLTSIVSGHSPIESRGLAMGTFRSIGSLARALGPCLASFLFWTLGPMLCYVTGAIALLLPLFLMKNLNNLTLNKIKLRPSTQQEIAKAN